MMNDTLHAALPGARPVARSAARLVARPVARPVAPAVARVARVARPTLPALPTPALPFSLADLRGLWQLGIDAGIGLTDLIEQMHGTIAAKLPPLGQPHRAGTRGVAGLVYGGVRRSMRLAGRGVDRALQWFESSDEPARLPAREAALAVANGIWGDHLAATGNPLTLEMCLRVAGRRLELDRAALAAALPAPRARVAVLVHGLCMNDLQWARHGHHHGDVLAALGCTVVAAHFNSGLHVADNGARLAALLEQLADAWPVPLEQVLLVGHSMGGLVARSALWQAELAELSWRRRAGALVCLGTPHHGARLERGGHLLDTFMELSPYVAPFTRLGKARSAGITDLRWGNLRAEDVRGRERHAQSQDDRTPTPLPADLPCYLLAATQVAEPRGLRHHLLGDGLVTVASAWGEHRDAAHRLHVPASHKRLIAGANHWDLLNHPEAAAALRDWLGPLG